jgi:hypothetical protein
MMAQSPRTFGQAKLEGFDDVVDTNLTFTELMKLHGPFHTGNPHVDMIADFHRQDNLKRDMNASRVVKSTSTNM